MTACAMLVLFAWSPPLLAGKFNARLSTGDAAPDFAELQGVDGRRHSLADCQDAEIVVVVFTCCHSPCATAYEARLAALDRDYRDQGVRFIALSVSRHAADSLEKMKQRAAKAGWTFPYLHDRSQQIGQLYGATVTPQVFVLDRERKIRYQGRIDDQLDDADVKKPYLRAALDALLGGRNPDSPETRPEGCAIEYE